jgi:hypothetical protein
MKVVTIFFIYVKNLKVGFEVESSYSCFLEVEGLWFYVSWDVYLHILKKNGMEKYSILFLNWYVNCL